MSFLGLVVKNLWKLTVNPYAVTMTFWKYSSSNVEYDALGMIEQYQVKLDVELSNNFKNGCAFCACLSLYRVKKGH